MGNFTNKPEPVEVIPRGDGLNDVYLRRNIAESALNGGDGPEQVSWDAEEVHLVGRYDEALVRECFDDLWVLGSRRAMTDIERIEDAEGSIADVRESVDKLAEAACADELTMADILEAVAELGGIVAGGEM